MCGISGILDVEGDPGERKRRVAAMTAALTHRGPDDVGFYRDDAVDLGFRRLAVIDLETGMQPIRLESDRAVLILNGEIYNFRELRSELVGRHRFRSRGDVEVVLALYDRDGPDAFRRLNGMFALALWDRERRALLLARDRFGIKPLFWCREDGAAAFSSELGGLLAGGVPADRRIDRVELRHFLYQKYPSPRGTLLQGVRSIPPATVLEITPEGERTWRYWEPEENGDRSPDRDAAVAETEHRLRQAARRQLVADVPVGVFLSGGLDSGTLASLVRASGDVPLRTFSVGFTGPGARSELPAAAETARYLGSEHHELSLDAGRVAGDLPRILGALDGPLGDPTVVPTWYVSRLARETVTVALSGEGADELFGGYERQRYDAWMERIGGMGRALAPAAMTVAGRRVSARLRRRLGMPKGLRRQLDWSRVFEADEIDSLAAEPLPGEDEVLALHDRAARDWIRREGRDPVNARLAADRELFLPGDLLPKVDRMSMAHSLEVRVPYLDHEVVDFVLPQPGDRKVRGREGKWLLRRVSERVLPAEVSRRPKLGFDVPVTGWLRTGLREVLEDLLGEDAVRRRGLFRPEAVRGLVRRHLAGEEDAGDRLWCLMALEGWMRAALDRLPTGVSP